MSGKAMSGKAGSGAGAENPLALVMQGGGALGAYEWGAVTELCAQGYTPVAVTGVSIGAINAAAIAGAPGGDIPASLASLWAAIAVDPPPFWPPQFWPPPFWPQAAAAWSMLGNPNFFLPRSDVLDAAHWTGLCDVTPMRRTLERLCRFDQIRDPDHMLFGVSATDVATGRSARFLNTRETITACHILASGALPPGFPPVEIDGRHYWDGGLFDNTPMRAMIDLLVCAGLDEVPIVVIDLFPGDGPAEAIPRNMAEVHGRLTEIAYENRFWDDFGGPEGLAESARVFGEIIDLLPADHDLRETRAGRHLDGLRRLRHLHVIPAPHAAMTGGVDFSRATLARRFETGRLAAQECLPPRRGRIGPAAAG